MKEISWGFIGCGDVTERKSGPAFNEVEGSHIEAVNSVPVRMLSDMVSDAGTQMHRN